MNLFVDILFVVFVFAIVVQLFYAFYFFIRLSFYKEKSESFNQGVSVIICAKDEAEMLSANLPSFLEQDYSEYEVIVVDDQSVDGTKYLLKDLEKKYFNLKVVTIDPHIISRVGKKFALTLGIKTAKYDYVLLSDADCRAFSKNWITKMTSSFVSKEIVLEQSASSIKIILDAHCNVDGDVRAFYSISNKNGFEPIFTPFPGFNNLNSRGQVLKKQENDGQSDKFVPKTNSYGFGGEMAFREYTFSVDNLPSFRYYRVKLCLISTSQVYVPRVKDLRVITLA